MKSQPTVEQTDYSSKEADEEQHNREMKSGNQDNADPDPIPKYGNNFTAGVFSYFLSVLISGLKKSQKQQQLSPMLTFIVFIGKTRARNTPRPKFPVAKRWTLQLAQSHCSLSGYVTCLVS